MATIPTRCDDCRRVLLLAPSEVTFVRSGPRTTYGYRCSHCGACPVRVPSTSVLAVLLQAGREPVQFTPPTRPPAPPLTEDDLIAFGRWLEAAPSATP